MVQRLTLLCFALGALHSASALNPRRALTQYSRTRWTQEQGLPQDRIRRITQTPDGYLWLGTDEGLARFDGYEFITFSRDNGNLPSNAITALVAGKDGSLWIGTPNGLVQYRDRSFRSYTRKDGLPDDSITSLRVDHAGILWVVAGGYLSRFNDAGFDKAGFDKARSDKARFDQAMSDKARFTNFQLERDIPVAVAEDSQHHLYAAGYRTVTRFDDGKFIPVPGLSALRDPMSPLDILVDHADNLWILGRQGLIERSPNGAIREFRVHDGLQSAVGLRALSEDHDGNLWIGTDGGLARLEGGRFRTLTDAEAGERISVQSLFEDLEGNLWVGSNRGLARFRDDLFAVYGKTEGLPSDELNTVYQDHRGRIWVGLYDGGVVQFSLPERKTFNAAPGFSQTRVFSIRETSSGELLSSTYSGLQRVKDGRVETFAPPVDALGRHSVYDALEGSDGQVWLALPSGLAELRGGEFRIVLRGGPLLGDYFTTLERGRGGSLWAGTYRNGLWRVKGDQKQHYTMSDGLTSDSVRSLSLDRDGTLWIGTFDGGLDAQINGKFVSFRVKDGLLSDNISKVLDDGDSLWLSTTRGICRISKQQLRDFAEHRIQTLRPVNYGVADGLRSAQGPRTFSAGGDRHKDGSLWFITNQGIAVYEPGAVQQPEMQPLIHLAEMTADDRPVDWANAPRIPPGSGRLQIRYTSIHLRAPDRVRYSYKLDGLDSDWLKAGDRRVVEFNSLRQGQYRFHVKAELPTGAVSEASYDFELLPHFYETAWFRFLVAVMVAGLVWMAYKLRERQVRARFAAVLEERARLAREVHDTFTQAFAGICSQLDAVAICMPEPEHPARSYVDLARRMARHSLMEARRSLTDLRATAAEDQDLAAALDSGTRVWAAGSGVEVEFSVSGQARSLPKDVTHHTLRIAQEAVTNALKHAKANRVVLKLDVESKKLTLRVLDNGCGFKRENVFTSANGHFGLIGMRERAERLRGELRLDSRPGEGTQVEVTVPLP